MCFIIKQMKRILLYIIKLLLKYICFKQLPFLTTTSGLNLALVKLSG